MAALGSYIPFEGFAFQYDQEELEKIFPSLTLSFCMMQVQKVLTFSDTQRPDIERILRPNINGKSSGNAFMAGKFGLATGEDIQSQLTNAYQSFVSNKRSEENREFLAYCLGNLTAYTILETFKRNDSLQFFTDPQKATELDAMTVNHFYLKNSDLSELNEIEIEQLFQTLGTRTIIKYHTLKATEGMPMEWIEGMINVNTKLSEHFKMVAKALKNPNKNSTPKKIFNPQDKFLLDLSPTKNSISINDDLIGEFIGVPTMFCMISKGIINATKTILDFKFN